MSLSNRDNTFSKAKDLGALNNTRTLKGAVGKRDKRDFFEFSLSGRSRFSLSLNGLKDNADVFLYNENRGLIGSSRQKGKKRESIVTELDAGPYYVRVQSRSRRSRISYRLRLAAQEIQDGGGTDNTDIPAATLLDGSFVAIEGDKIILSKTVGGVNEDTELFLFDGSTRSSIQLTNNTVDDEFLAFDGSTVVWQSELDTVGKELFFHNSTTGQTKQITNSSTEAPRFQQLIDSKVFWFDPYASDYGAVQLYVYDTATANGQVEQIGSGDVFNVKFDGTLVTYNALVERDSNRTGLFFYNSETNTSTQVSNSNASLGSERIVDADRGYVLWSAFNSQRNVSDLFLTNITTNQTNILIGGSGSLNNIYMSGSNVAWTRYSPEGGVASLYFYTGVTGQTVDLFDNPAFSLDTRETFVGIVGPNVVWSSLVGTDTELRLYKGNTQETISLTDGDNKNDTFLGMDDSTILWKTENQIFAYNIATNGPKQLIGTAQSQRIIGTNILWTDDASGGLFYYNSGRRQTTQLINSIDPNTAASVDELNTSWDGANTYWVNIYDDALYFHDGATNQTKRLAQDSDPYYLLSVVGVSGSNAVWTNALLFPAIFYSNGS